MSGMPKRVQAKHIPDVEFLAIVHNAKIANGRPGWVFWWDFMPYFEIKGIPDKVVYAKARALIKRDLLGGCVHPGKFQCRGDLELTTRGEEALAGYLTEELSRKNDMPALGGSNNG